jgi:hypothetical protein
MNPTFQRRLDEVHAAFERLVACPPMQRGALTLPHKTPGVYVFSEGARPLYVGRSRDLRKRIFAHSRPSVSDTPLAFRLAREETRAEPTYKQEGSRKALRDDPQFASAYQRQKARIAMMDVQFVVMEDPVNQALLEIYASDVLKTPFNDFNTT